MADHARAQDLAAISIDFELTADERDELNTHLAGCAACQAHLDGLLADAHGIATRPRVDAPAAVSRRVLGERRTVPPTVRWAVAVAAVLVVAVGVALGTRWIPLGGSSGAAAPSEPITAASGAPPTGQVPSARAPSPSPTLGLPQVAWVAVPDQPAFDVNAVVPEENRSDIQTPPPGGGDTHGPSPPEAAMEAGVSLEGAIVAVGHGCLGPEPFTCQADVWRSSDGRVWTAVPTDETLDAGADIDSAMPTGMLDVTDGGPGVIAVGAARGTARIEATVWLSTDGGSWHRGDVSEHAGDAWIEAVSGGRLGYAAVGEIVEDGQVRAAAWTSRDGIDWSVAEVAAAALGDHRPGDPVRAGVFDLAWLDGRLVAVGAACPTELDMCQPAVWTSTDEGATWERVPVAIDAGRMLAVTPAGEALVVGGDTGTGDGAGVIWRSGDGVAWEVAAEVPSGPLEAVLALPGGVVAGGRGTVLGSLDTRSWERTDDAALVDGTVKGFASTESGVIALGFRSSEEEEDHPPAAWVLDVDGGP